MTTASRRSRLAALALAAASLAGCASTGDPADPGALSGAAILTIEDARGQADARETLTMLRLPLPGLGAPEGALAEWSQLETSATADRSPSPVSIDPARRLALVAGEASVDLVRIGQRMELVARIETPQPIGSVSLAPSGLAAALSEDGRTLYMLRAEAGELRLAGAFPLDLALGDGARAVAALLSPRGETLAVLDAGRSRIAFMNVTGANGSVGLETLASVPAGAGLVTGAWTPDGSALVVAERLLPAVLEGVEVVRASGRIAVYPAGQPRSAGVMVPGFPVALAISPDGARVAAICRGPGEPRIALVARDRAGAALLDIKPAGGESAGIAFDARGRRLLVAMPEDGALALWTIVGGTLRNTNTLIDTGPGVSAVAVLPE